MNAGNIVSFDDWLHGKNKPAPAPAPVTAVNTSDREQQRVWAYIEGMAGRQAMLATGSRNDTLNTGAYKAFRLALGVGLPIERVDEILYRANVLNGQVGDDGEHQVRATLASARAAAEAAGPDYLEPNASNGVAPAATIDPADIDAPARTAPQYTDFAALLSGGLPDPPKPTVLQRTDGHALFYHRKRNDLYGDPEDGKTMVALAAAAQELRNGGNVLFLDFDNNGPQETAQRLIMLGADPIALADQNRFRHIEPADSDETLRVVADCAGWATMALIDCVGELLPMFRASSDSADDYTRVMQMVSSPLEHGGAAVILLDHQAKGAESRSYGAGGTMAKRRAVSGSSINLVRKQSFTPGQGGIAELWINKDRPGGLRRHCAKGEGRRQFAGTFILDAPDADTGIAEWRVAPDRSDVPAAASIDPVMERHYDAVVTLTERGGGPATAAEIGAVAHGLPEGTPLADTHDKATRRQLDRLVCAGRLVVVSGRPKRWKPADMDTPEPTLGVTDSTDFVADSLSDSVVRKVSDNTSDNFGHFGQTAGQNTDSFGHFGRSAPPPFRTDTDPPLRGSGVRSERPTPTTEGAP